MGENEDENKDEEYEALLRQNEDLRRLIFSLKKKEGLKSENDELMKAIKSLKKGPARKLLEQFANNFANNFKNNLNNFAKNLLKEGKNTNSLWLTGLKGFDVPDLKDKKKKKGQDDVLKRFNLGGR